MSQQDNCNSGFFTNTTHLANDKGVSCGSLPAQYAYTLDIENAYNMNTHEQFLTNRTSGNAVDIWNLARALPNGAMVAGGAAMLLVDSSLKYSDIDLFFCSIKAVNETIDMFIAHSTLELSPYRDLQYYNEPNRRWDPILTIKAHEIGKEMVLNLKNDTCKIQMVIIHGFNSPKHCLNTFDFTCNKIAIDNRYVYTGPTTVVDILMRRLDMVHIENTPKLMIKRITKYIDKGFKPTEALYDTFNKSVMSSFKVNSNNIIVPKLSIWNKYAENAVEILP